MLDLQYSNIHGNQILFILNYDSSNMVNLNCEVSEFLGDKVSLSPSFEIPWEYTDLSTVNSSFSGKVNMSNIIGDGGVFLMKSLLSMSNGFNSFSSVFF